MRWSAKNGQFVLMGCRWLVEKNVPSKLDKYLYIYISTFSSIRSYHILIDDFLFFVAPFTSCFVLDKTIQFVTQNYKLATFLTNISFNRVLKLFITNDSVECGNDQYLDAWNFRKSARIKMIQKCLRVLQYPRLIGVITCIDFATVWL